MTHSRHSRPYPWYSESWGACDEDAPSLRCELTAAAAAEDVRLLLLQQRQGVFGMLEIRSQVGRGAAGYLLMLE
jgi:hypothetical protein